MNTKGQLGVGDIKVRGEPLFMELPNGYEVSKIYAEGHSSACITRSGQRLLTWGSGKDYRLMQSNENNVLLPTYVSAFQDILVEKFCFTPTHAIALVHTRIAKVSLSLFFISLLLSPPSHHFLTSADLSNLWSSKIIQFIGIVWLWILGF